MKVPPKRKGNSVGMNLRLSCTVTLNESPSEKEGKCCTVHSLFGIDKPLNESPSEKEGKSSSSRASA